MPQDVDARRAWSTPECRKASLDRKGAGRAAFAARHCPVVELRARNRLHSAQKKSQQCRVSFSGTLLEAVKGDALEIDELVVRYRFKRRYRYLWLVVSRLTHQVLAWIVDDRSEQTLQKLWWMVPAAYRRKLVYTDFYEAYAKWFAPWQHRPCAKGEGKTSVIEGLNNKWRNRISGLVRKTVCVRYWQELENRLWIVIQTHNQLCLRQIEKLTSTV